ncbi:MAG: hypothetical protein VX975_00950 [Acidobacteriota bacterium]|nr:hypothetical protein [Acidobacteriota bacterium]
MRSVFVILSVLAVMLCAAAPANADLTAFAGANATPSNRPVKGFAAGLSLLVIGFEFEFSDTAADEMAGAPGLRTGMFNLLLQTPFGVGGLQFYGTVGGGIYQEGGGGLEEINADANVGVDVTTAVAGPLRRRLDYHAPRLAPGRTAAAALRRAQQAV